MLFFPLSQSLWPVSRVCCDWSSLLSVTARPTPAPPSTLSPPPRWEKVLSVPSWSRGLIGQDNKWGKGWFTKGNDPGQASVFLPSYIPGHSRKVMALAFKVQNTGMVSQDKAEIVLLSWLFYKWENKCTGKGCNLLRSTHPINGGDGILVLLQGSCLNLCTLLIKPSRWFQLP